MSHRRSARLAALAVALTLPLGLGARSIRTAGPQGTAPRQTPPKTFAWPAAVEAAFTRAYPQATVKHVSKETENGRTQYEVESVDNGRERDLNYLADGTVVDVEEAVSASDVPPAVTAAVSARYPKATITRREKLTITKGHVVQYELGVTGAGAKVTELVLTPDGGWVSPKKG